MAEIATKESVVNTLKNYHNNYIKDEIIKEDPSNIENLYKELLKEKKEDFLKQLQQDS